jgi:hypothetical protein
MVELLVFFPFEISVDHSLKLIISKTGKLQHLLLGKASVCRFHESVIAARRHHRHKSRGRNFGDWAAAVGGGGGRLAAAGEGNEGGGGGG